MKELRAVLIDMFKSIEQDKLYGTKGAVTLRTYKTYEFSESGKQVILMKLIDHELLKKLASVNGSKLHSTAKKIPQLQRDIYNYVTEKERFIVKVV